MKFQLSHRLINACILLIIAFAAMIRLINLQSDAFWIDEVGHIQVALSSNIADLFNGVREHAAAAPLDYLLLRFYQHLTGAETRFELRLPYMFYGVLSVFLIYLLGKAIYNPATGLLSAYALSISYFHIYYSQEVRFYSLSLLIGLLSTLTFLEAWRRPSWPRWLLWAFVCTLGLYTHYFLLFVFSVQIGWLLLNEKIRNPKMGSDIFHRIIQPGIAFAISILTFLPWFLWARNAPLISSPQLGISLQEALINFLLALGPSLAFLLFIPFGVLLKRESWLLLGIVVFPFLGVYLADNIAGYFFNARQVIFSLPFSIVLGSASLVNFFGTVSRAAEEQKKTHLRMTLVVANFLLLFVFTWASGLQIWNYFTK